MMKLLLVTLFLAPTSPALAGEVQMASLSELKESALLEQGTFHESDCKISVNTLSGGLSLSMENESGKAELVVRDGDEINLRSGVEADGSFIRTFEVSGKGYFHILHADDSYIALELSAGGRVVKCEMDF